MTSIGKIVLLPKGTYDSSATYNHLDWVRYDGKAWVCKQDDVTGVTPVEGDTWTVLAEDGTGGASTWNDITGKPFDTIGAGLDVNLLNELEVAAKNTYIPTGTSSDRPISGQGVADAISDKQNINLNVPISVLSGSKLTVEDALHGINNEIGDLTDLTTTDKSSIVAAINEAATTGGGGGSGSGNITLTLSSAVASGTTIRIPASGTDSRIKTTSNIVIMGDKSDGTPVKYSTFTAYDGYVNLVPAENLAANTKVGITILDGGIGSSLVYDTVATSTANQTWKAQLDSLYSAYAGLSDSEKTNAILLAGTNTYKSTGKNGEFSITRVVSANLYVTQATIADNASSFYQMRVLKGTNIADSIYHYDNTSNTYANNITLATLRGSGGSGSVGFVTDEQLTSDSNGKITFPSGRYVFNARVGSGRHYVLVLPESDGQCYANQFIYASTGVPTNFNANQTYYFTYAYLT